MNSGIRQGRTDELGEIMALIAACVRVMRAGGSDQWDEEYPNAAVIAEDLNNGTLYVCEEEGRIAGILVLDENQSELYESIEWSLNEGRQLVMHRLAVHPDIQGKGVARRLIAFAEELALREGYAGIRLDTYAKNERALKLYPGLGYEQRGEVRFPGRTAPFPVFEKVLERRKE